MVCRKQHSCLRRLRTRKLPHNTESAGTRARQRRRYERSRASSTKRSCSARTRPRARQHSSTGGRGLGVRLTPVIMKINRTSVEFPPARWADAGVRHSRIEAGGRCHAPTDRPSLLKRARSTSLLREFLVRRGSCRFGAMLVHLAKFCIQPLRRSSSYDNRKWFAKIGGCLRVLALIRNISKQNGPERDLL